MQNPELCEKYLGIKTGTRETGNIKERHFLCGSRLKQIREEVGLLPSEIIEVINYPSEKQWDNLEKGEKECPESLLYIIGEEFGVSLEWLKHGIGMKFVGEVLYLRSVEDALSRIRELSPQRVYLCLVRQCHIKQMFDGNRRQIELK